MRVAPFPCIMLLCRPLSSSKCSPLGLWPAVYPLALSTYHYQPLNYPAISAALSMPPGRHVLTRLLSRHRLHSSHTRELPRPNRLIVHRRCSPITSLFHLFQAESSKRSQPNFLHVFPMIPSPSSRLNPNCTYLRIILFFVPL